MMNNFYNSPGRADLLIKNKTDVYGTLRVSRKKILRELESIKLKVGETIAFQRRKVCVMKWKDKKDISLISIIDNLSMMNIKTRKGTIKKPQLVDYNYINNVDRINQQLSSYVVLKKRGKKYYKKIFFHLLDLAIWNAFVLLKIWR